MNFNYNFSAIQLSTGKFIVNPNNYQGADEYVKLFSSKNLKVNIEISGLFCYVNSEFSTSESGWKVHVSSILNDSEDVLLQVSEFCLKHNIAFKFIRDKKILGLLNSKAWERSSSGKFITLYPSDEAHFKFIIERLYKILKGKKGPYILSDRRYKDSKVLYYRYGSINNLPVLKADESREFYITGPHGEKYLDDVNPYFELPTWLKDPFANLNSETEESQEVDEGLKENRYIVHEVIDMTNSGGVYLAFDTYEQKEVILKEARPYVNMGGGHFESISLRENEYRILKLLKGKEYVPKILDAFYEWEHFFIVVSKKIGVLLSEYIADVKTSIVVNENMSEVYNNQKKIFLNLLYNLEDMHKNNISYGDFSSTNIIVQDNEKISFIDFELSNEGDSNNSAFIKYSTLGYRARRDEINFDDRFDLDKEGLGFVLLNFYTNASEYIKLSEKVFKSVWGDIKKDYQIPREFVEVIEALIFQSATTNLTDLISKIEKSNIAVPIYKEIEYKFSIDELIIELDKTIKQVCDSMIISSEDFRCKNRLFPTYPNGNPHSIYFGDLGVLVALSYIVPDSLSLQRKKTEYLNRLENRSWQVTPGLFSGLAGEALGLYLLGYKEKAVEVLKKATKQKTILNNSINLKDGIAGLGLAYVFFYKHLEENEYMEEAEKIASELIGKSRNENGNVYWESEGKIEFGLGQGVSGIAFFFISLYEITKNEKYLMISKLALRFVIANAVKNEECLYFYKNSDEGFLSPYLEGAAGVAKVMVAYLKNDFDKEIENALEKLLNGYVFKYSKGPSFDFGLAAIGYVLIDLYHLTKDPLYIFKLREVAEGILNYKVKIDEKYYFPSSFSGYISFEFATGISGIIVLLKKLLELLLSNENIKHGVEEVVEC